jgi:hypothetical protein
MHNSAECCTVLCSVLQDKDKMFGLVHLMVGTGLIRLLPPLQVIPERICQHGALAGLPV